ncbi:MAG: haloacid dehalogenase type II [Conexivisphaerales archaeon]
MGVRIKAITFDVFSALFDWESSLRPVVKSYLSKLSPTTDVALFLKTWREKQLSYAQIDTILGKEHTSFLALTEAALRYTFKKFGITCEVEKIERLTNSWCSLTPYPDAEMSLKEIKKRGYKIAVLSNGDRAMLEDLTRNIPLRFDAIFSAQDAGVYKPNPRIYTMAEDELGLERFSILHVAGSTTDAIGSKTFGMETALINRTGAQLEEFGPKPDYIFRSIEELLKIV